MKTRTLSLSLALSLGALIALLWLLGGLGVEHPTAQAQSGTGIIRVAITGTDVLGCGSAVAPCRTVQYAVDQAASGDEIRVATGIYTGVQVRGGITQVVYIAKGVAIRGGYTTTNWTTPDSAANPTTLDAQGLGRVIHIAANYSVTLEGLRIVNGWGKYSSVLGGGGGVAAADYTNGRLVIRQCEILSNTVLDPGNSQTGGGVYFRGYGGTLVLESNRIISNTASVMGGGVYVRDAVITMTNNLVQNNSGPSWGGGASLDDCTAYVADNTFQGNSAHYNAGLEVTWGDLTLTRNAILSNTAELMGGGLYAAVDTGHTHSMTYNLIQGNVGSLSDSGGGGGAYLSGSGRGQFVFSHNRVLGNFASKGLQPSSGGGLSVYAQTPALITDNLFQGNWANDNPNSAGNGGGLYVSGQAWLERNRILDNRASQTGDWGGYYTAYGAGVYVTYGIVTMTNNIVAGNLCCVNCWQELYFTDGDGIYVGGQTSPAETQLYLYHNTLADNGVNAIRNDSAAITMSHNILSGQARDLRINATRGGYPSPTAVADYTLWWPAMKVHVITGTFVHTNDFTGTPDFISTPLDSYHLGAASQAIDRGPGVGVTDDIDGNPRPIGSSYDLGADEFTNVDLSPSTKSASPQEAVAGQAVTFTIVLRNSGSASSSNTVLLDAIPTSTSYLSGSAQVSSGILTDTGGIAWTGAVAPSAPVTITFQVTVNLGSLIKNTAIVADEYGTALNLVAWVNQKRIYLPLVVRN